MLSQATPIASATALDTPAVTCNITHLSHPRLPTQLVIFDEEMPNVQAMIIAKVATGAKFRLLIGCNVAKRDITFEKSIDFPGATDTLRGDEDEDFE